MKNDIDNLWDGVFPWYVNWKTWDRFIVGYDLRCWTFGFIVDRGQFQTQLGPLWFEYNS